MHEAIERSMVDIRSSSFMVVCQAAASAMRHCSALLHRSCRPAKVIRRWIVFPAFLCAVGFITASAWADEPAAMVEQISGEQDDLSTFDYLYPGRVIDLGSDGSLVLVYFQTCLRERILGGKVTVRNHESSVQGSIRLSRSPAGCIQDDRQLHHDDQRASAAMVFRGQASIKVIDHLAPRFEDVQQIGLVFHHRGSIRPGDFPPTATEQDHRFEQSRAASRAGHNLPRRNRR